MVGSLLISVLCILTARIFSFSVHSLPDPFSYCIILFPTFLSFYFPSHAPSAPPNNCLMLPGHQKKSKECIEGCSHCFQCRSGAWNGRDSTKPCWATPFFGMYVNVLRKGGACTEPLNCAQRAESWQTKIWIHGLERLELFYCSITSYWNQTNPKVQVAV